jgi:hypothetical protein
VNIDSIVTAQQARPENSDWAFSMGTDHGLKNKQTITRVTIINFAVAVEVNKFKDRLLQTMSWKSRVLE